MSTVLILLAAWAAVIAVIVVAWHHVMRQAHRQDVRPTSSAHVRVPAPRQPATARVTTHGVR